MSRIPLRTGTDVLLTMETRLNKRNPSARQGLVLLHAVSGDPFGCAGVLAAQGALRATSPDPVLPFTDPMQLVLHKVVYQTGGRSSPLIKVIPLGASGEDVAPTLNPMHGAPPPSPPLASPQQRVLLHRWWLTKNATDMRGRGGAVTLCIWWVVHLPRVRRQCGNHRGGHAVGNAGCGAVHALQGRRPLHARAGDGSSHALDGSGRRAASSRAASALGGRRRLRAHIARLAVSPVRSPRRFCRLTVQPP